MNLIKKIQLAGEKNNFDVYVTGNKRDYKYLKVNSHTGQKGLPYKVVTGDGRMFRKLCVHLIQQRKGTQGYSYTSYIAGVSSRCEFIDGDLTYVISSIGRISMILIYKNKK